MTVRATNDTDARRVAPMFPAGIEQDMFDPVEGIDPKGLEVGLQPQPDSLDGATHRTIVERVMASYAAMKRDQPSAAAPYQPTGEWVDYLAERNHFYEPLAAGDVDAVEAQLRHFWRNPLGLIVKEYASFADLTAGREAQITRFLYNVTRNYLVWKEIFDRPVGELAMPRVGDPWGLVIDGVVVAPKACRYHGMAQRIDNLLDDIAHPVVAEIGAGFGGVASFLLSRRAPLTFVDFDLPETVVLAAYYVQAAMPDAQVLFYGESALPRTREALQKHRAVFLPNYAVAELEDNSVDLHLNMFSLSEVGEAPLRAYMNDIARTVRHYFLHNNMDRTGVVNRGFERTPASAYPVDSGRLKLLAKQFDLYHGQAGDYREFLYQRRVLSAVR